MSLIRHLITEGKKEVIVNKIGLTETLYNWIIRNIDKKLQLWFANILRSYFETVLVGTISEKRMNAFLDEDGDVSAENLFFYEKFKWVVDTIIKEDNKPDISLHEFSDYESFTKLYNQWSTIRDYRNSVTPSPNLKEMSWVEAYENAEEWHSSMEASDLSTEITDVAPDAEIIHTFDDGTKWVDMKTSNCSGLGNIMGHCASTDADTMLQLITSEGKFRATVAFDYDGTYRQLKGIKNRKPDDKYTPYIQWLFTNGGKYQFKGYNSEYQGEYDFKVTDLPEDIYEDVVEEYPELEKYSRVERAYSLYSEGKLEEARGVLNDLIGERCGYGRCASVEKFGDSFEEVLVSFEPSDLNYVNEYFKYENVTYALTSFVTVLEEAIYLKKDFQKFLDYLSEEVHVQLDNDITKLFFLLSRSEINNVIENIYKENPNEYRDIIQIGNRETVIRDIIERKKENDPSFQKEYEHRFLNSGVSFMERDVEPVIKEKYMKYIENLFDFCGFVADKKDNMIYFSNYFDQYEYGYEEDIDDIFIHSMNIDSFFYLAEDKMKDYKYRGYYDNVHYAIVNKAMEIRKEKNDLTTEELMVHYFFNSNPNEAYLKEFREKLIADGYLDSIYVPATEESNYQLFKND